MKAIELTQGKVAFVDDEDYERLSAFRWYFDPKGYAATTVGGRKNKKHIKMHRLIMDAPPHLTVDHINHDGLDNRKANLRLCTMGQNAKNKRKQAGLYKGVHLNKKGKYVAQIGGDGKVTFLGNFDCELIAAVAYDKACREVFGEYACPNFPDEKFLALWDQYKDVITAEKRRPGTSKYVGVYWSERDQVWRAQVAYKKRVYPVGTFASEEEAHIAREDFKQRLLDSTA